MSDTTILISALETAPGLITPLIREVIRDATPTCVTQGPDRFLYVGTLALVDTFVLRRPSAKVWRLDPGKSR
ncbi:MAG: hypothetical protein ACR2IH_01915 [Pyrinomonadaceae bacterium]